MDEINDRNERIGSSMIHNVCFEGGRQSWDQLVLKVQIPENPAMKRGNWLEEPIMARAAEDHGWTYRRAPTIRKDLDGVLLRNTCDYWAKGKDGVEFLCEVKSHSIHMEHQYGVDYGGQVPDRVYVQCQMHCEFNNVPFCRVIAYFGGNAPRVFVVKRDREFWGRLEAKCIKFWNTYVVTKTPPPITDAEACINSLKRVPIESDVFVGATPEDIERDNRLQIVNGQLKVLKIEKEQLQNEFREAIGENVGMESSDWKITLRMSKPKPKTNYEALVHSIGDRISPECIEKFTTTKEGTRTFSRREINNG